MCPEVPRLGGFRAPTPLLLPRAQRSDIPHNGLWTTSSWPSARPPFSAASQPTGYRQRPEFPPRRGLHGPGGAGQLLYQLRPPRGPGQGGGGKGRGQSTPATTRRTTSSTSSGTRTTIAAASARQVQVQGQVQGCRCRCICFGRGRGGVGKKRSAALPITDIWAVLGARYRFGNAVTPSLPILGGSRGPRALPITDGSCKGLFRYR